MRFSFVGRLCAWPILLLTTTVNSAAIKTSDQMVLELEKFQDYVSPVKVCLLDGAQGDGCVVLGSRTSAAGKGGVDDVASPRGMIEVGFDIPERATYAVWVRVQWHCVCARAIRYQTSTAGSDRSLTESPVSDGVISSMESPGVWHWIKVGTYTYEPGHQFLRLIEDGHLAALDEAVLTTHTQYSPPGYTPTLLSVSLVDEAEGWIKRDDGLFVYPLCDDKGQSFFADLAFKAPPCTAKDLDSFVGMEFDIQKGKGAHRVEVHPGNEGTHVLRLVRTETDGKTELLKEISLARVTGSDDWHGLGIRRMGEHIDVYWDGSSVVSTSDGQYLHGSISVVSSHTKRPIFRNLAISGFLYHRDLLDRETGQWNAASGK